MKNNKANPPGPNKPLVALVREDYINESVHFFGSAAKHVGREQDYNTQTSVNYSSAGIDYSSGPSRLLSSGGVAQRKLASNLADNSPAMPGNSRLLEMWKMSPIMPASSSPAKVKQMRDKGHSASIELFGQLRRVTKETVEDEDSSASPSRERGRLGRSRKHFDDSSKSSTSIKKEVDITTYVKEQRKIIKKVAGTTNGNKTTKPQGSTVRYEIKEFKKETPNSHLRYAKPIKSKKESNGNGYESMVEEAHQSRKFSSYQKQPIMSNIEKSKNSLRKVLLAANMVKTHEDSERKSIHHSKYRTIDDSCEELEGSRSRMLEHISKLTKQYEEPSYDARERFKQGIRQDGWLSRQTESEGSEYQKFSHPNLGMESQDNLNETRRPKSRLVSDSNPVLPLSINYDEKTTTRNRNRQDYSSQLNLTTEDSTPQNQKPNKPELLIIGDSQKPLSTHFKKKVPQVGKNRALRTGSVASEVRQPSLELSKIELRKKMLEYGKKIEKPKVNRTIAANESIDNMVKLGKAKSNPDLSFAFEKNMPKPEVLERLARGIKPKVDKSEIHEITRRHRERFERLNTQPNESPVRKNAKRAELLERKSKVKELDQVSFV